MNVRTAPALYLNHLGAVITEGLGGKRACPGPAEIKYLDTFEYLLLDMRNLETGKAVLSVKVRDLVLGTEAVSEREFEIRD